MVKCDRCGRFMECKTGASWVMRYSGFPPEPDHEDFRCKDCTDNFGPLFVQNGIRESEAGIFSPDPDSQ